MRLDETYAIVKLTATGGNSVGITIPVDVLDELEWDRGAHLILRPKEQDGEKILVVKKFNP